eukprot:gnl/MRDRNA2_/MRDRNA2_49850_c0_seq1.p1 gnl/MRDRNA2_/MRDRNA2_49850_c0~~gnl/MRDRNA2_/MRDRNA2_49850_c0_seq1.p1  ORF type:complete len:304 (-),score=36.20 gnl/MRDRNA2_/MRDRNA2_49850_c0_seq1:13-924(-)
MEKKAQEVKSSKVLESRGMAQEYLGWLVAPIAFQLPWLFVITLIQKKYGVGQFLKNPRKSGVPPFLVRLLENCGLWSSSYGLAWVLFQWIKRNRMHLKYVEKAPPSRFVMSEICRSFGGIVVLTIYQGCYRARSLASYRVTGLKRILTAVALVLWADFHFYAVHRLLHAVPFLYHRVHKVHHLSNNVDPWSGLSMHPVEHIFYFSSVLPLLLIPFVPAEAVQALSDGLITFPIPAHIGLWPFEKHHFKHHREFNYNYGSSVLFDVFFGTDFEAYQKRKLAGRQSAADERRAKEAAHQAKITIG